MMNEKRREKLAEQIGKMQAFRPLAGAVVLEIGADKQGISAQMLVDAGAARVISTNYGENWPEGIEGAIERCRVDARCLADAIPAQSVDVIFGMAILEHIVGLAEFFAGARKVLTPGGLFFVHGGPIWTFGKGHHLFVEVEGRQYRFAQPRANPIRDWAHLTQTREGLIEEISARGVPATDAEKIGEWVYDSPLINRVGFKTMCDTLAASGLREEERLLNAFAGPPAEVRDAIERGPYAGQERYDVSGVTFAARP